VSVQSDSYNSRGLCGKAGAVARPLRLALVASSYNYIRDGVALTLNRLVAYLERHGVEVLVFAPVGEVPAFEHHGTLSPVPSVSLPLRPEYRMAFPLPRKTVQLLRDFRPDLMHIALAPDPLGFSALRTAKKLNIPVVASCHTRFETYLKHYWGASIVRGVLTAYLRRSYGACREVYVPSQSMIEALQADGLKDNFRLWPRGVDTVLFHPGKRSQDWRARHGIGSGEFVVAFVSRLVREKELDTVAATLGRLEARGLAHRALIVGDGPERIWLEKQLPRAVFTGFLTGEELATAYASSDVFLFPSETETFGNVTLEAMASGLPCVCADATGSRSLVVHAGTGYLATPRNAEDFAGYIAAVAEDRELHTRLAAGARERSLGFDWEESMAVILGYYHAIAGASP
jgi:phosphatidylinositol alpha 1,6-mannosyltransferase